MKLNVLHRMTLRIKLIIGALVMTVQMGWTQQDSQYSQYMYTPSVINPAYVGSRGLLSMTTQYRAQWLGLEGAPRTINFTSNGPLKYDNMGLGVTIISETIGPQSEQMIAGDYSYTIEIDRYTKLSFGIKAGVKLLNIDYTKLEIYDTTEDVFRLNVNNRLSPIVGTGAYVYGDIWYAGLSVPNFLTTDYYDDVSVSTAKERMTFYGIGGYVFYINPDFKFKPTSLVKFTSGAPIVADVSANFLLYEKLTLGASYRLGDAVTALAGFQITPSLLLGYSYDMSTTNLGNYNSGTHEVFIRFDFGSEIDFRLLSPRFF